MFFILCKMSFTILNKCFGIINSECYLPDKYSNCVQVGLNKDLWTVGKVEEVKDFLFKEEVLSHFKIPKNI